MKYIIGKKVGMVQVFDVNGKVLPATVVTCEPNKVISVKPNNTIVVGYKEVEEKKLNKPQLGFFKKLGSKPYQVVSEFKDAVERLDDAYFELCINELFVSSIGRLSLRVITDNPEALKPLEMI